MAGSGPGRKPGSGRGGRKSSIVLGKEAARGDTSGDYRGSQ